LALNQDIEGRKDHSEAKEGRTGARSLENFETLAQNFVFFSPFDFPKFLHGKPAKKFQETRSYPQGPGFSSSSTWFLNLTCKNENRNTQTPIYTKIKLKSQPKLEKLFIKYTWVFKWILRK